MNVFNRYTYICSFHFNAYELIKISICFGITLISQSLEDY